MRLQGVPRETTCPWGRSLGVALLLFFRKGRRARRPAALPSRSWRAFGAPCTWAGVASTAYAYAPKGKCGGPPEPSGEDQRQGGTFVEGRSGWIWLSEEGLAGTGETAMCSTGNCAPLRTQDFGRRWRRVRRPAARPSPSWRASASLPVALSPGGISSGLRSLPRRTVRERVVGLRRGLLGRQRGWRFGEGRIPARPRISLVS